MNKRSNKKYLNKIILLFSFHAILFGAEAANITNANLSASDAGYYNILSSTDITNSVQGGIRLDCTDLDGGHTYKLTAAVNGGTAIAVHAPSAGIYFGNWTATASNEGRYVSHAALENLSNWPVSASDLGSSTLLFKVVDVTDNNQDIGQKSFTLDMVVPTTSAATLTSDNALNGTSAGGLNNDGVTFMAKSADNVTLTFTSSENLARPTGTYAGVNNFVVNIDGDSSHWIITDEIDDAHAEGLVAIDLVITDKAGNYGTNLSSVNDLTSVNIDKTAPSIALTIEELGDTPESGTNTYYAKDGSVVKITVTCSNDNLNQTNTDLVLTLGGSVVVALSPANTNTNSYTATQELTDANFSNKQGEVSIVLSAIKDLAGNTASNVLRATNTPRSMVIYDSVNPNVNAIVMTTNGETGYGTVGNTITLEIDSDSDLRTPTVNFQVGSGNTVNATTVVGRGGGWSDGDVTQAWAATLLVSEQIDDGGVLKFTVNYTDLAGNAGAEKNAVTVGSAVTIDYTAPTAFDALSVSTSGTSYDANKTWYAKQGQSVTVAVDAPEDLKTSGGIKAGATIGLTTASLNRVDADEWTISLGAMSNEQEGPLAISFQMVDMAGNESAVFTEADYSDAANTAIYDKTKPTLTTYALVSNNVYTTAGAKDDDVVTLTFVSNDVIQEGAMTVKIANTNASNVVTGVAQSYKYTMTMDESNANHIDGVVPVSIIVTDLAGNQGDEVTQATLSALGISVTYDKVIPGLDRARYTNITPDNSDYEGTQAKEGDQIRFEITGNDDLYYHETDNGGPWPQVRIAKRSGALNPATLTTVSQVNSTQYLATYTTNALDDEGNIEFQISFLDEVGNVGSAVVALVDDSEGWIEYDKTNPSINTFTYVSDNDNSTALAKVGDKITVTIQTSDEIQVPIVSIADGTASSGITAGVCPAGQVCVTRTDDQNWTATYVMRASDAPTDEIVISMDYKDLAGNEPADANNDSDANLVPIKFDPTTPTLTTVTYETSNPNGDTYAMVGDNITINVVSDEVLAAPPLAVLFGVSGIQVPQKSGGVANKEFLRTITVTAASDGGMNEGTINNSTENAANFKIYSYADAAGNSGADKLTPTDDSSIRLDQTPPTKVALTFTTDGTDYDNSDSYTYLKQGAKVTLNLDPSEDINQPTVMLFKKTADGLFESSDTTNPTGDFTIVNVVGTDNWTFEKALAAEHAEGEVEFTLSFTDLVGNELAATISALDNGATKVWYDKTAPTVQSVTSWGSNNTNCGESDCSEFAIPGNAVTLIFTTLEDVQTPVVYIAGQLTTPTQTIAGNNRNWTAVRNMDGSEFPNGINDGNNNTVINSVPFSIALTDFADISSASTYSDSSGGGYSGDKITFDNTGPTLTSVDITSNNVIAANNKYAKEGNTVTIEIEVNEKIKLATVTATVAGVASTGSDANKPSITLGSGDQKITITKVMSASDPAGDIAFSVSFSNVNGYPYDNGGSVTENNLTGNSVNYDKTKPTIDSFTIACNGEQEDPSGNKYAKSGNVITVTLQTNEDINKPNIHIAGNDTLTGGVTVAQGSNKKNWTATYTMQNSDDDTDSIDVDIIELRDLAYNLANNLSSESPTPPIIFDKTVPTFSNVTIISPTNNNSSAGLGVSAGQRAKVGDNILITFTVTEARGIQSPVVTLESLNSPTINSDNAPIYTATFTSIPDFGDAGPLTFNIKATDYAGNENNFAHGNLVGGNANNVVFDGDQPVISILEADLEIESDGTSETYAKVGDDVTLTFKITDNNDQIHDPTVRIAGNMCTNDNGGNSVTPTYNDLNTSGSWDSGDTWTVTYTMQESDEDVSTTGCTNIRFQIDVTDLAGNVGTAVTHSDVVTNVIFDRTAPQLAGETSALKIWTDAGTSSSHAKSGDEVNVQVKFNEATEKPTIAIASKTATVANSVDGGFTWIGSYTFLANQDNETGVASTISVQYADSAGNSGIEQTQTTDASFVIFDKTVPTIDCDSCLIISSNNIWDDGYDGNHPKTANTYAIAGNEVYIFVKADNNEVLDYPPIIEFKTGSGGGDYTSYTAITPQWASNYYRATYTMQQGDLEGNIDFKVTIKDLAGNTLADQTNTSITDGSFIEFDTQAPVVTGIAIDLKLDYDSGISNADDITNIAKPRFTITGLTPNSGDSAIVVVNGDLGNNTNCVSDAAVPCREYAKVVGAGISNFGFLADVVEMHEALTSNNVNGQAHTFEVYLRDPAGNLSSPSTALTVTYDGDAWTHPTGAKTNFVAADDSGFDDTDNYTNTTSNLSFEIEKQFLPPDELAQMKLIYNAWDTLNIKYLNAPGVSTSLNVMNSLNTNQTVDLEDNLGQGWYAVRFTITDRAGNESDTSNKELVYIDISGPGTPTNLNLDASTDSGISDSDNLTNSNSTLTFKISDVRETDFVNVFYDNANGTQVQVGSAKLVTDADNSSTLDNPQNYAGAFSFTLDGLSLIDSTYSLYVICQDGFGNISNRTASTLDITIDTDPSSVANVTIDLVDDDDTGKLNSDNLTSDRAPRFNVSGLTVGDQAYLYLNGVIRDTVEVLDGASTIFTPDSLDNLDATYTVTVKQKDDAGNLSVATTDDGGNFILDVTSPTITADAVTDLNDNEADDSGYSQTDNYTNVTQNLTFNLQQAFLPPLENAFIKIYYWPVSAKDEATIGNGTVTTTEKIMTGWVDQSMDLDDDLSQGWYAIKFTLTDSAGNETDKTSAEYIFIDIVEPTKLSGLDLDLTTDSGVSNSDNLTNSSTILTFNISGTRETDYVRLFYTDNTGNPVLIGEKQVTVDGGVGTPDNPVSNPNIFNFSLTGLSLLDGTYEIYAIARDYMGNNSSQTDDNLTIIIDTTPSVASGVTIDLDDISDTGKSDDDYLTKDRTPQFTVTGLTSGDSAYLYISDEGTKLASAEIGGSGIVTFSSDSIAGGSAISYSATIKMEDDAGNISLASNALDFILDTEAPNNSTFQKPLIVADDNTCIYTFCDPPNTSNMSPRFFLDGLTTNLDSISLMIRGLDPISSDLSVTQTRMTQQSSETVTVSGGGVPSAGKYAVYYYLIDDAGNYSIASPEQNVIFDNLTPSVVPTVPDLINTVSPRFLSDTGEDSTDNLTNEADTKFKITYGVASANQRGVVDKITHAEPWVDVDNSGSWNTGETYTDLNFNGIYDEEIIERISGYTETSATLIPDNGVIIFEFSDQYLLNDSNSVSYVATTIDSAGNERQGDTLNMIYDLQNPMLTKWITDDADTLIWVGDGRLQIDFLFSEPMTVNENGNDHLLDTYYPDIKPFILIDFPPDFNVNNQVKADLLPTSIYPGDSEGKTDQSFNYYLDLTEDLKNLNITTPAGEAIRFTLIGTDKAGNEVRNATRDKIILDIIEPTFAYGGDLIRPLENAYINEVELDSFQWNLSEKLQSGKVIFDNKGADNIDDIEVALQGTELTYLTLTNPASFQNPINPVDLNGDGQPDGLVDGAVYDIIFNGVDKAGNTGLDTVKNITYDTTRATAELSYSRLFATNGDTVVITATFNESMKSSPSLVLKFADDVDSTYSMNLVNNSDSTIWTYNAVMPEGIEKEGRVVPTLIAKDLANNMLKSWKEKDVDDDGLEDSLYLDNTDLIVGFVYDNITQPLIQVVYPSNTIQLNNVGKGGDEILVTATLTDSIIFNANMPKLQLRYGIDNSDTLNFIDTISSYTTNSDRTKLFFNIVLNDSSANDGLMHVSLIAKDRAEDDVVGYLNSSDSLFRVDNIPPAAFQMKPTLFANVDPTLFTTYDALVQDFYVDLDNDSLKNWYNNIFTNVYTDINLPAYEGVGRDTTMRGGKVIFKVGKTVGSLQVDLNNDGEIDPLTEVLDEVQVGSSYLLDPTSDFGWQVFNIEAVALNTILQGQLSLGDTLKITSYQTDIHGNTTKCDSVIDESHSFYFDDQPMVVPTEWANGGNIFGVDAIYSTDKISVRWNDFTDDTQSGGSGFYKYIFRIVHQTNQGPNEMKGYLVEHDGDTVAWDKWADVSVADPNTILDLLFNSADVDTLYHDNSYEFQLYSEDLAGNKSDTVSCTQTRAGNGYFKKFNSAPEISSIPSTTMYEDTVYSEFQTISVTDLDFSTFQSDSISYSVQAFKDADNIGLDPPTVPYTDHLIDIADSLLSWDPKQSDVGIYTVRVVAEDLSQLSQTVYFPLEVIAVNDAPDIIFVDEIGYDSNPDSILVVQWEEDDQGDTLELTEYIVDVDNDIYTEMEWKFSFNKEDLIPIANQMIGPPTPKRFNRNNTNPIHKSEISFISANSLDTGAIPEIFEVANEMTSNNFINVAFDTVNNKVVARFDSDSNFFGEDLLWFKATDPYVPFDVNSEKYDIDSVRLVVMDVNDPPVVSSFNDTTIWENDSLFFPVESLFSDVDDDSINIRISALTNPNKITVFPDSIFNNIDLLSSNFPKENGISGVYIKPQRLWSDDSQIKFTVTDTSRDTVGTSFLLDVMRVTRPQPSVSIIHNNAFANYLDIFIIDTAMKTVELSLEVQSENLTLNNIAPYVWSAKYDFSIPKQYEVKLNAQATVGDTIWKDFFALSVATPASRWIGMSSDGRFTISGEPGSVISEKSLLITDSSLFNKRLDIEASYLVGHESFVFQKPVRISFDRDNKDMAIYTRKNGAVWIELPSISSEGQIITYSQFAGYYRLGQKTIIVPELTGIHQNYPNPFNPVTNIKYDIGLLDGLEQNVTIEVYNIMGQYVQTLVKNKDQIGQFIVQWNGQNEIGENMPTGIYFIRLSTSSGLVKNSKMMLLK